MSIDSRIVVKHGHKQHAGQATSTAPSLYPAYLPYPSQHRLFKKVQAILEDACYDFGRKTMGAVLDQRGWDSPECVELNVWCHAFRCNMHLFDPSRTELLGKPLPDFLGTTAQLRHTAVHRLRLSAKKVEELMVNAEGFATLLENDTCIHAVSRLRRETTLAFAELARNKDLLECRLTEQLKDIANRRAELDRLERQAIESMLKENKDYERLAGAALEDAMASLDNVAQSMTTSEETCSDTDAEIEGSNEVRLGEE